jgi:glycerophosphoryl diester phosphodiesterase
MASRLTLAELSALDFGAWHSSAYAGEPIPTLSSIAAFTLANQVHSNIEIKPTTGDEAETGRRVALAAQALWAQASLPPLLSSFSEVALEAAQLAVPTLPRALLIEEEVPADWPQRLERLGCMGLNLNDRFVTQALVQEIRQKGYTVAVWTVNDAERVRELLDWGCNGIFTDKVTTIRPDTL